MQLNWSGATGPDDDIIIRHDACYPVDNVSPNFSLLDIISILKEHNLPASIIQREAVPNLSGVGICATLVL